MHETSKACKRRFSDGAFHSRYFVGNGIDIGGGPDPLGGYIGIFPLMLSCRRWDREDGDAQYMTGVEDDTYDFVHSSHCLEHMVDPLIALKNWLRILKPGGHLIITVPDEDMYERGEWPSARNPDHKHSFTLARDSTMPASIFVPDLLDRLWSVADFQVERIQAVRDFYRPEITPEQFFDQTMTPNAECAIEIILLKTHTAGEPS